MENTRLEVPLRDLEPRTQTEQTPGPSGDMGRTDVRATQVLDSSLETRGWGSPSLHGEGRSPPDIPVNPSTNQA